MKNLIKLSIILIAINTFGQYEKKRVFAPKYDQVNANLIIDSEGKRDTLKLIEEVRLSSNIKMKGKQYNQFFDSNIDNGTYTLKKVLRLKPIDVKRFLKENYLAEYFYNESGKTIIILQKVKNNLKLK